MTVGQPVDCIREKSCFPFTERQSAGTSLKLLASLPFYFISGSSRSRIFIPYYTPHRSRSKFMSIQNIPSSELREKWMFLNDKLWRPQKFAFHIRVAFIFTYLSNFLFRTNLHSKSILAQGHSDTRTSTSINTAVFLHILRRLSISRSFPVD